MSAPLQMFTADNLLLELRKRLESQTQKSLADQLGFTPQYINDLLRERREISAEMAKALGYERKVYFQSRKTKEKA